LKSVQCCLLNCHFTEMNRGNSQLCTLGISPRPLQVSLYDQWAFVIPRDKHNKPHHYFPAIRSKKKHTHTHTHTNCSYDRVQHRSQRSSKLTASIALVGEVANKTHGTSHTTSLMQSVLSVDGQPYH